MIIDEMTSHFLKRTDQHKELVEKWYNKIVDEFNVINKVYIKNHDQTKYSEPELTPYIYITWDYHCKANNIPFSIPEEIKKDANEATIHHILSNLHHPECWDENFDEEMFNKSNRDDVPEKIVDATKMPEKYIYEMVADWLAISEERNTNVRDWADKNINIRWKFSDEQIKLIYNIIKNLGGK